MFPLPILSYVFGDSFIFENYKINDKICLGLGRALAKLKTLRRIYLKNNHLTDSGITNIIRELNSYNITSIIINENILGSEFSEVLHEQYFNRFNNQLKELNLNNSTINE